MLFLSLGFLGMGNIYLRAVSGFLSLLRCRACAKQCCFLFCFYIIIYLVRTGPSMFNRHFNRVFGVVESLRVRLVRV